MIALNTGAWVRAVGLMFLCCGCGFTDSGLGTATLWVQGGLDCTFDTQASVVTLAVSKEGSAVVDANVTLQDDDTKESLHVPFDGSTGQYRASWPGFHRRVTWQIWRGADGLMARLEGPSRHTVAHPRTGAWLKQSDGMGVQWAATDGVRAERVVVRVGDDTKMWVNHELAHDSGALQLAASGLPAGWSTLTVQRLTAIVPAGAAQTSSLTSSYSVTSRIMRQP